MIYGSDVQNFFVKLTERVGKLWLLNKKAHLTLQAIKSKIDIIEENNPLRSNTTRLISFLVSLVIRERLHRV